ncbi:flavodoxin family protein [Brucella gallinifaecis]|uniref:flavodoxin family protein n=1 Tax=Brucella gallinifaecis TaxID=215590 RepID=UPI002360417D|nr:NAD(P)H-dependent oxidoreductase [Brucella gallinifaecis]
MARILIAISSNFGANLVLARLLSPVLEGFGANVRIRRVEVHAPSAELSELEYASGIDLEWADGFVFSSPSHTGLMSSAMKAFIDANHEAAVNGNYLNKTFAGMATSGFAHAGQERVVDDLNTVAAAWGCLVVTPSTANPDLNRLNGNPFGLSFVLQHGKIADVEVVTQVLKIHFKRFVAVTKALTSLRDKADD